MSTVTNGTRTTATTSSTWYEPTPKGTGWVLFAGIMLLFAGVMNVIWGIAAVAGSGFFVAGAHYILLTDLNVWGWIAIGFGTLEFIAAFSVWRGGGFGRWFGIFAAALAGIGALMWMPAYPLWSLVLVTVDMLVVYALAVYGGKPEITS